LLKNKRFADQHKKAPTQASGSALFSLNRHYYRITKTTPMGRMLEITDATGRVLRRQVFSGKKTLVERGDLPAGMLFVYVRVASGRVVAEN
jgi:hypothetical protein